MISFKQYITEKPYKIGVADYSGEWLEIRGLVNPDASELVQYISRLKPAVDGEVRFISTGEKLYVWNAYHHTHDEVMRGEGIEKYAKYLGTINYYKSNDLFVVQSNNGGHKGSGKKQLAKNHKLFKDLYKSDNVEWESY